MKPRPYQEEYWQKLSAFLTNPEHYGKNPLILAPTGVGKALMIAMAIWALKAQYPHLRMLALTHVKELIESNSQTLLRLWPDAPVGVYSAGLSERNASQPITYAGIQSVYRRPAMFGKIDFVFIDEAHLVSDNGNTMYAKFLAGLRARNADLIVVGYTATGFRAGLGTLTDGQLFDQIAYDLSSGEAFVKLIEDGYLIEPIACDPGFELDASNIGITAGEFKSSEASQAMQEQQLIERAVKYTCEVAADEQRLCCLTFAQSIDDAEFIAELFTRNGYPTSAIHSKMQNRDEVLEAYKAGELWNIVNVGVLTTGFDHSSIDLICMLRLTRSPGLHVQMLGRGTRPVYAPGYDLDTKNSRLMAIAGSHKHNCRVLDFCGNTKRLGPVNYPVLPHKRGAGGGEPPVRVCPQCGAMHHPCVMVCTDCGYPFPPPVRVTIRASEAKLISRTNPLGLKVPKKVDKVIETLMVTGMAACLNHGKDGKRDTMKVAYRTTHTHLNVWVCVEHPHGSFPRRKADEWWKQHMPGWAVMPSTSNECALLVNAEGVVPSLVNVWMNTKYPEIQSYDFEASTASYAIPF